MSPRSYIIIGCGHFGSRAVGKFLRKDPRSKIIVVDKNKKPIKKISHLPAERIICDGLLYLIKSLSGGQSTNYIVPSVPFHFAFEFILSRSKPSGAMRKRSLSFLECQIGQFPLPARLSGACSTLHCYESDCSILKSRG
jgi:hypothetical protein